MARRPLAPTEIDAVHAAIAAAWGDALPPFHDELVRCSCPECVAIAAHLRGRRWQDIDCAELYRACGSGVLALTSPVAFRYLLPALLLGALAERDPRLPPRRRLELPPSILDALRPSEGWRERIDGLGAAKLSAILAFLRLCDPDSTGIEVLERRLAR